VDQSRIHPGTVSIRSSLLTRVLLLILLLSVAILVTSVLGTRAAVQALSGTVISQAIREVDAHLHGFFTPAVRGLEIVRSWGEAGLLEIAEAARLNPLFAPVLRENPQVSSLLLADDSGREHMLLHTPMRWSNRQTRPQQWGTRSRWLEWTDAAPAASVEWKDLGYDPRERPWYRQAVEGTPGTVYWTVPYKFFTTKDPGITASTAFTDGTGRVHVIGFDVLLKDITRFTMGLTVLASGVVAVLTDDGRVIGLPRDPQFEEAAQRRRALLHSPQELGITVLVDAVAALRTSGATKPKPERFESGGEAWWGAIWPFQLSAGQRLSIAVMVPEHDLLGRVAELRYWILAITLLGLALAIWLTVKLARRYSDPIEALVEDSERIRRGDLAAGAPIATPIREVLHLAEAHERMRAGLRTLLKLEDDLKLAREIQQNTFPNRLPRLDGFDLDAWSVPAEETGGDTYDLVGVRRGADVGVALVLPENAERAVLLVADATGHGIGPALSVTQVRAMLRMGVRTGEPLADIVRHMNEQLCADLTEGRFITAWFGELNATDCSLVSFSAGQGPLLYYEAASSEVRELASDAPPLGILETMEIDVGAPLALAAGDMVAVISDGIFEAKNTQRQQFGVGRVGALLARHHDAAAAEILATLRADVEAFTRGTVADDDRTALLIKRV